jgi:hypothetical protein
LTTNLLGGTAEWLYATLYCARGQAENLITLLLNCAAAAPEPCASSTHCMQNMQT